MQPPPPPPLPPGPQPVYYPATTTGQGEYARSPEHRPTQSTAAEFSINVVHILTQLCLGAVIGISLFIANSLITPALSNHIYLCTFGYFVLTAQAIISFGPFGWANNLKHEHQRIIHAIMQMIGSILAIAGSFIKLADSNFELESAHGRCGLAATILTMITFIAGVVNFAFFFKKTKNKFIKLLHSSLGIATISVAFMSLIIALHHYFADITTTVLAVFAFIGTLLMAAVNNATRILNNNKNTNNINSIGS